MTVKELITELLECPLDAEVDVRTSNKDSKGRTHTYGAVAVEKTSVFDAVNGKQYISILFHNWELDVQDE